MDLINEREDLCNTGPDDETVIREKKRLRRVSFAENTEIHIFDREDEDSGVTPPQPPPSPLSSQKTPQFLGLLAQPKEDNAEDGEDDEEDRDLRDFDSSSPGSAVSSAASATSNDEENFFGPVSASFIKLGRQDSAASDEHDITLDSTAFSMHFQSLAQSDSGVSCKTPTPSFEGKHSMPTNSGSDMVMTGKKRIHYTSASGGDSSGGCDSGDMSLVGRNPSDKYDFGKLSPSLEALLAQLAQNREDNSHASASDLMSVSKESNQLNNESKAQEPQLSKGVELNDIHTRDSPIKMACYGNSKFSEGDMKSAATPIRKSIKDCIFNPVNALLPNAPTCHQTQTPTDSIQRQGIHPENLNQQDHHIKLAKVEQRQESSDTRANDVNALRGNANGSINLDKLRSICEKDFLYQTSQKEYGNFRDLVTPLRGTSLISPLGSSDLSFLTRSVPTKTGEKFSKLNPMHKSASPRVRMTATAIRLEKRFMEGVVQDSVRKETESLSESDRLHSFLRKGPLSYTTIQSSNGLGHTDLQSHQTLHEKFSAQDVGNSGRKRRSEDIEPTDNNNSDEIGNKNPKVTIQIGGCESDSWLDHCPVGNHEAEKSGRNESQEHWINVLNELPGAMERLLSPSIGELNNRELDILEYMLARMQKAIKYEKLSTLVQFQRSADLLANSHQGRIAEARWLEKTLVYEHAKLILFRTKQERLRKRVQLVQFGIQEAQNLKLRVKNVLQNGAKVAQNKDVIQPSPSIDLNCENVDIYNRVIAKRQELGSLDIKVKNLTKSLLASCKIKEEPSPEECLVLINDYLRKRTRCRLIQKELQLCEMERPKRGNGHLNLILNYYDVLHQRFTMSRGSLSKLATVTRLNDVKITKCFPNMNACTAFSFVFDGAARNLVNSKSLPVETQMTRSLLHNLLIVIGEVQLAGMELSNLIQTSFRSPCDGLLELELCFVDFKTGNKVLLIIDTTSLNRGVYPLEIQPRISLKQPSESLLTEIEAAVIALKAGHSMILRLCKSVSQVVCASSR